MFIILHIEKVYKVDIFTMHLITVVKQINNILVRYERCVCVFRCIHEYLDVYSEVQQSEATELINSPFGGRYCGPIPPRRRISLYRTIALAFYTDKNSTYQGLFSGRYTFVNDCKCYKLTEISYIILNVVINALPSHL